MIKAYAPICLFVFNRPSHTKRTIDALLRNELAKESDLFIFSDGFKTESQSFQVNAVREHIRHVSGFRSVTIIERDRNFGLACSIIDGVTNIVNKYERAIILEDDLLTSPHFLTYMNEGLNRFVNDENVISIHGYVYPVQQALPEAFFLRGADCWGWGTWRRGWLLFNTDGRALLDELRRRDLINAFDFNGSYGYSKMLKGQIDGLNDSWAVRWYASAFLANKLTLYPGRSLVHNIGNDSSGTHCGDDSSHDTELSMSPIDLQSIDVTSSEVSRSAFEAFFRKSQGNLGKKLVRRLKIILSRVFS